MVPIQFSAKMAESGFNFKKDLIYNSNDAPYEQQLANQGLDFVRQVQDDYLQSEDSDS